MAIKFDLSTYPKELRPTRYELSYENGHTVSRVYTKTHSTLIEEIPAAPCKPKVMLLCRKNLTKMAKMWGVPFIDKTI